MLYIKGDHGQLININRAIVIDVAFDGETNKWEARAYFDANLVAVIRAYEIEDHARQCVNQLEEAINRQLVEFEPCISETVVKVQSSKSMGTTKSTESKEPETSPPSKYGETYSHDN